VATAAGARWTNWAGNQEASPTAVAHPRDAGEVALLAADAAERGRRIRPTGSGHSFNAIGRPEGMQIVLDRCADLVNLDRSTGLVTVQAGMTLRRLNRILTEAGLAMTNLGDIEEQTVAGAISTGTHGTGARFGGIATQVRRLELVLGDGTIVTCSPREQPGLFTAARVGLGALGVITAVTLQAEPLFALHTEQRPTGLDEILESFDKLAETTDHVEFSWFPHTRATLVKRHTRLPLLEGLEPRPRARRRLIDDLLSNAVAGTMATAGRHAPETIRPMARARSRTLGCRTFTDLPFEVLTSPRRVRFDGLEYGVPRQALMGVVAELVSAVDRSGLSLPFPVQVRVAAADDIPLSTASGRDTGYIAVYTGHRSPRAPYFDLVEAVMKTAGGRPHWGTAHSLGADELRTLYPQFGEFLTIRADADPRGIFTNAHLNRILGPLPPFP
jgi:L-gulonolactone oxidase